MGRARLHSSKINGLTGVSFGLGDNRLQKTERWLKIDKDHTDVICRVSLRRLHLSLAFGRKYIIICVRKCIV